MLVTAFMPYVVLAIGFIMKKMFILKDKGF